MPRDLPDWGAQSAQKTVYEVTDLGELAARLGSIVTHDRRGDVIWLDDFENGLGKWATIESGTGAVVDLSIVRARNGLFSVRLLAGSTGDRSAQIERSLPFPVESPMGVEFSFQYDQDIDNLQLIVIAYDGTNATRYAITISATDDNISYDDDGGVSQESTPGVGLTQVVTVFHTAKLIFNMENDEYVRLVLDNVVHLLTNIAAQVSVDATLPSLKITIINVGRAANNDLVRVDDVIVTQNEPI